MNSPLCPLFDPRSVAVLGASSDVTHIGGRVLDYLIRGGFKGRIIPVNPNRSEVQGLATVASVAALPEGIDVAIVVLPVAGTIAAVAACAARGIRGAIVFSSGSTSSIWLRSTLSMWVHTAKRISSRTRPSVPVITVTPALHRPASRSPT